MIHPTALVDPAAKLGEGVEVGPFTVIGAGVELGAGTTVGSHCELGHPAPGDGLGPLRIGEGSVIRSHSIFYAGSTFGPGLKTGHRVTVREATHAGDGMLLGTNCDLQGETTFGRHVRLYSNAHITAGSTIGDFVWIFPSVVTTNDPHPPSDGFHVGPTIERYAVIATGAVLMPGVRVGEGALIAANALVRQDVPPGTLCFGMPGKNLGRVDRIPLGDGSGAAYPWRRHFQRGYPEDIVREWVAEFDTTTA